jgi:hypothetical protein
MPTQPRDGATARRLLWPDRMTGTVPAIAAALAAAPLAGCFDLDLDFHSTGTSVQVTASPELDADVWICAGPSDLLDCNESDRSFTVSLGSASVPASTGILSFGSLDAFFPGDPAGQTLFATRDDGADGTVVVPPELDLQGPTGAVHRGGRIPLTWFATHEGKLTWTGGVVCGSDEQGSAAGVHTLADTGHADLTVDELPKYASGTCTARIELARTYTGTMSAAFGSNSSITAEQDDSITFDLVD